MGRLPHNKTPLARDISLTQECNPQTSNKYNRTMSRITRLPTIHPRTSMLLTYSTNNNHLHKRQQLLQHSQTFHPSNRMYQPTPRHQRLMSLGERRMTIKHPHSMVLHQYRTLVRAPIRETGQSHHFLRALLIQYFRVNPPVLSSTRLTIPNLQVLLVVQVQVITDDENWGKQLRPRRCGNLLKLRQ